MDSKPVEFRRSPACCESQNACPAFPSASAEKEGDVNYFTGVNYEKWNHENRSLGAYSALHVSGCLLTASRTAAICTGNTI
jgi:hypothetical protein